MKKTIFLLIFGVIVFESAFAQKLDRRIIYFDFGKYDLRPESVSMLDSIYYRLSVSATDTLYLIGHTDSVGSSSYNEKLSQQRVNAITAYLESKGIEPARLRTKVYGESKPAAENDSDEGRQRNRRVDLLVKSGKKEFVCKYHMAGITP